MRLVGGCVRPTHLTFEGSCLCHTGNISPQYTQWRAKTITIQLDPPPLKPLGEAKLNPHQVRTEPPKPRVCFKSGMRAQIRNTRDMFRAVLGAGRLKLLMCIYSWDFYGLVACRPVSGIQDSVQG